MLLERGARVCTGPVPSLRGRVRAPSCEVGPDYDAVMAKKLVIKVTAGADAPERCSQAFTVAAVAAASGVEVSLWLTGESAWFALPGRAAEFELPHAAPLPDLLDSVLAATGSRCARSAPRAGTSRRRT